MKSPKKKALLTSLLLIVNLTIYSQETNPPEQKDRWVIQPNGSINWRISERLPHSDHIEMSGEKVSLWVAYQVDQAGVIRLSRKVVFPTFRMLPDETRSHIAYTFEDNELPRMYINNKPLPAVIAKSINHSGIMRIMAETGKPDGVKIEHSLFPSVDQPMVIEKFVVTNTGGKTVTLSMEKLNRSVTTDTLRSKSSPHTVVMKTLNEGRRVLEPGRSTTFAVCYFATDHPEKPFPVNPDLEENNRGKRIVEILQPLQLETPDTILNTAFAFAKIRATESIFKTKRGYLHGPGGLEYYAAIWANDQAEYVSPYFAFSGDRIGIQSAMNCYRLFATYMNPEYKPLPSSIVAEGDAVWKGAGDRGDQAMIAYGASRFALAYGKVDSAKVLWPLISWCLEYCRRHINDQGVVESQSDELEGRFPSGKANLSTNCLYYDALVSASMLARQLHLPEKEVEDYKMRAGRLKLNIEKYFGAYIGGFDTYKYYETNTTLRAWISMPLAMGIYNRSKGTIGALFSPQLWTADGLATEAGKETFWDRSTLYALRGVLQAGATDQAMTFLHYYSRRRLLGEHVPYPVEAYPEGSQRHLSAESGLYCRVFIEGLFGMRPTGFNSFSCTPRLPKGWKQMSLRNIHAFDTIFDLRIVRQNKDKIGVIVNKGEDTHTYTIREGETIQIKL
ncbi:hypothetical protein [Pedobacter sp.]|jgi:hypothetical protein|uniref:hypothetical protein n=1 Tax=Pedobacter sp. TaxID=1411316 RepID=UPI002CE9BB7C|nr:hypothetical protein [Pedobacter sp.]HWW37723.1 hypothetical protein [Pedobacter sp.]